MRPRLVACLAFALALPPAAGAVRAPAPLDPAAFEALAARQQFAAAESLALAHLGETPRDAADSARLADWVVRARWRVDRDRLPGTVELAERSLALRMGRPGSDSLDLASSLESVSYARTSFGRLDEAARAVEWAIAIRRRALAPDDPAVARLVHHQGAIVYRQNRIAEARDRFNEALSLWERGGRAGTAEATRSRLAVASATTALGQHAEALRRFEEALAQLEGAPESNPRDLLFALNSLVPLYGKLDRYAEASAAAERAVALSVRVLGPDNLQTGYAYRNLGYSFDLRADYASARDAHTRAAEILERALGPESAVALNARQLMTSQLNHLGEFEEALRTAEGILARAGAVRPPDSLRMVAALNSMAFATEGLGRPRDATAVYRRALEIAERVRGPGHPDVGFQAANLAGNHLDLGEWLPAEPLLARAVAIAEKAYGPEHSSLVSPLRGLGLVRLAAGRLDAADSLFARALAVAERVEGPGHPDAALARLDRASTLSARGKQHEALALALEGERILRGHLGVLARGLPEREALRAADLHRRALNRVLALAAEDGSARSGALAWEALAGARGLVLEEMARRRRASAPGASSGAVAELRRAREALAILAMRGPAGESQASWRAHVDSVRGVAEALEVQWARGAGDRREPAGGEVLAAVREALPREAAMVAYARYRVAPAFGGLSGAPVPESYLALVMPAGGKEPRLVPLGSASALDSLVTRWSAAAGRLDPEDPARARAHRARLARLGSELRVRAWDPVRDRLGPAALALVVPDGALQLVNFAALPAGDGRFLAEAEPALHLLATEREAAAPAAQPAEGGLLALGDPEFDGTAGGERIALADAAAWRGIARRCTSLSALRFGRLPHSRAEVEGIAALWDAGPATVLTGDSAAIGPLERLAPGRRVLHLATHGFFLDPECAGSAVAGSRGVGAVAAWDEEEPSPPERNPLLIAGLALAGANRWDEARAPGILTAGEIATLDLDGVEWAVLSGCRTGVGEIHQAEGISGLRRAFSIAGARTVITSLWPVGDATARRWMEALYRLRLQEGAPTVQAVRGASLELLRQRRKAGASDSPFYWAPFLAAGDWR